MSKKFCLRIQPPVLSSEVHIGKNLVNDPTLLHCFLHDGEDVAVITTHEFDTKYPIARIFPTIHLPGGEKLKTRQMKAELEDRLLFLGFGKKTCLIAIGGGALLDLVGFVAATYCRGIPFIVFPTTLLAMTDAAHGGKTGINMACAKNWLGAFHFPRYVIIDTDFLNSLPPQEMAAGMVETIKHAAIAGRELFSFLEENLDNLLIKGDKIEEMIERSCQIKHKFVEQDPFDRLNLRISLNFGHTVAHALEATSEYTMSHGEAVAIGMLVESSMACQLGHLSDLSFQRLLNLIQRLELVKSCPKKPLFELLAMDKKGPNFVILQDIGKVAVDLAPITDALFQEAWEHTFCFLGTHC